MITGAVFVDVRLRKAFDSVDHSLLLAKLESYSIAESELEWFSSYLNNRSQVVTDSQNMQSLPCIIIIVRSTKGVYPRTPTVYPVY